jgi:inositol-phosphate transport system permease protein
MTWKQRLGKATPLVMLTILTIPVVVGYLWIMISTFSQRTYGLVPVDRDGKFGGLTLENWSFLWEDPHIWNVTLNTIVLAVLLTVGVLVISTMAGYALSRISFPGRKAFLGGTLILHAFPSVTLLISIYFVLRWIGNDTVGGVALVMVALQLPLGVWLMKGFFDNVSWDMERAALIDGCSRLRVWWEIMLPSIKPGIAALSIFTFIGGWGAYLIPYTYITDQQKSTISAYLRALQGDTSPVNYSRVASVGVFQLLPVLIFFIFTQEYLLSIFGGGTKGGT